MSNKKNSHFKAEIVLLILLLFFNKMNSSVGQDIQFSQFYANTLYLNPAFAGITPYTRVMMHNRIQWPTLEAHYYTAMVAVDHYFDKYKSGLGVTILRDVQGTRKISSTEVNILYSYELLISDKLVFKPGLQVGLASRYMDYTGLIYPDQYDDNGFVGPSSSVHENARILYPDVSSGGILYSDKYWVGFSAHHINRPNQSFLGEDSRLPVKYAFVGGYKFKYTKKDALGVKKDIIIIPSYHYKFQGKSDQLDLGLYGIYYPAIIGMWYRGIPLKNYKQHLKNNESFVVLAGWKFFNFHINYSYDFTISRLTRAGTGGAHELNIVYLFRNKNKTKRPMKKIPCPDLYND